MERVRETGRPGHLQQSERNNDGGISGLRCDGRPCRAGKQKCVSLYSFSVASIPFAQQRSRSFAAGRPRSARDPFQGPSHPSIELRLPELRVTAAAWARLNLRVRSKSLRVRQCLARPATCLKSRFMPYFNTIEQDYCMPALRIFQASAPNRCSIEQLFRGSVEIMLGISAGSTMTAPVA